MACTFNFRVNLVISQCSNTYLLTTIPRLVLIGVIAKLVKVMVIRSHTTRFKDNPFSRGQISFTEQLSGGISKDTMIPSTLAYVNRVTYRHKAWSAH